MRVFLRSLRTPLVASAFFFFWMGGVVLAWVLCPILVVVERDPLRRRRICQRIVQRAFRVFHAYMEALRLVEMRVVGADQARPVGPFVMVSNHPTLVDATAILASYDDVCCVIKTSLIRNFFVGRLLRFCGHIDGGNGDAMSGAATLQEALKRLDEGQGVLIFPEGSRSPRRGMHRFRRGAFELAARANVPLWPMFISCDPPALARGVPIWKHPETAARQRLTPQPVVHPGENAASSRVFCQGIESTCRQWLEERDLLDRPGETPRIPLMVDTTRAPGLQASVNASGVEGTSG
jgi:1-acyl-sn-glycerol-3-phosphate acyltransferase